MSSASSVLRAALTLFASIGAALGLYLGTVELALQSLERSQQSLNLTAEIWASDYQSAKRIAAWAPINASAQDLAARVAQLGAIQFATSQRNAMELQQASADYSRNSLKIRPAWAATWLNLAAAEFTLDASSPKWRISLARAMKIGDRNLRAQLALAQFRKQAERALTAEQAAQFQVLSAQAQYDYPYDYTIAIIRLSRANWVCPEEITPGLSFDPQKRLTAKQLENVISTCENSLN
jgi:hypothetical protein